MKKYNRHQLWRIKNKKHIKEYRNSYRELKADKVSAHQAVYRAIKNGKLIRSKFCQKCKKEGYVEAHHKDYKKWLKVQWLCRTCHRQIHLIYK